MLIIFAIYAQEKNTSGLLVLSRPHKKTFTSKMLVNVRGATVLIGLMKKSHKIKGFEQSINSINLQNK